MLRFLPIMKGYTLEDKATELWKYIFLRQAADIIFPNFSAGNNVLFLTDFELYTIFWQMSFYIKFSCLKNANAFGKS